MAPATSTLFAAIPPSHGAGLVVAAAALLLVRFSRRRGAMDALGWLLLFTGCLHIGLAFGHLRDQPFLSPLFALDGLAFLTLLVLRRDRTWWRLSAGLLLLGTIVAYLVYVGNGREHADPVGVVDKLAELLALGLLMLPHARSARGWREQVRWLVGSAGSLALTFAVGTTLWIEDLVGSGHPHGVLACSPNHRGGPGTVLRQVPCLVTPEEQAAADRLVAQTREGIAPYQDVHAALAAGYRPTAPDGSGTVHYSAAHPDPHQALDPRHPAALVYATTRHGPVLLGAMYQMPKQGESGPDIGGALTPWHYHTNICISLPGLFLSGLSTPFGQCPPWSIRITMADQLHVWTAPNPNGPFGDLDQTWARKLIQS